MSKLIGVFATEISSRVQSNLYQQLHKKAVTLGYNFVFFSAGYGGPNPSDTDEDAYILFDLAENIELTAMILHVQSLRDKRIIDRLIDMGKRKDIPIFLYDCVEAGYQKEDGVITINLDYKQGFADSVRHLIEHHNCSRIYMLAGMRNNKFSDDRIDAYKKELLAHNLSFDEKYVYYGEFWEVPAQEAIKQMLVSGEPLPDAICCANDSMAIAATKTLTQMGYRVPEDVRVTGFDGIEDGKYNVPVISTCEPRLETVPEFVFDAIENNMHSGEFMIPLQFYPKESCGCDNRNNANDKLEISRLMEVNRQTSIQHSMLSNMQLDLLDSCDVDMAGDYIRGLIEIFKGFSHVYCLRDNLECLTDLTGEFEQMRVQLNLGMLPEKEYGSFNANEIIPEYNAIFDNAGAKDIFIFRMLKCLKKKYGYNLIKATDFTSNEIKVFGQFSDSFTIMLESVLRNKRLEAANQKLSEMYERMSEIYIRDVMTGLYNRNGYYQNLDSYIHRADIENYYMHIISIDMDGMKHINDNFGHQEGDYAIRCVAKAIDNCFAQPCVGARFGGDEFMVALFTESADKPTQEQISMRLNNYLKTLSGLKEKDYSVCVSVGCSVVRVKEIDNIKSLEKQADDSMYINKRKRKGNVVM